jgi:hypothetical protein
MPSRLPSRADASRAESLPSSGLSTRVEGATNRSDSRPTPGASCIGPVFDAVWRLRRDMSGSAAPPFRGPMSRDWRVRLMLGPSNGSSPADRTTVVELLTHGSDAEASFVARRRLNGAPALTASGRPRASPMPRESSRVRGVIGSGRTMSDIVRALCAARDSGRVTLGTERPGKSATRSLQVRFRENVGRRASIPVDRQGRQPHWSQIRRTDSEAPHSSKGSSPM